MPSNRSRRPRGPRHPLTEGERHLLLTGNPYPAKGSWRDLGESWMRPFTLCSPAGLEELRSMWTLHRAEIMSTWTGKGLPWAAKEFIGDE